MSQAATLAPTGPLLPAGVGSGKPLRWAVGLLIAVVLLDVLFPLGPLRDLAGLLSVFVMAGATVLTVVATERTPSTDTRRWQYQAVACATVMLLLMASGPSENETDAPVRWLVLSASTVALVGTGTSQLASFRGSPRPRYLWLDALIVAVTAILAGLVLVPALNTGSIGGVVLLGCVAAMAYSVTTASVRALHVERRGYDSLFLVASLLFSTYLLGEVGTRLGLSLPAHLESPSVMLAASLAFLGSARLRLQTPGLNELEERRGLPRLGLIPAACAALAIIILSIAELTGNGARTDFFGLIALFGLIVGRLVSTLLDNRALLRHVERSGVFEENLRDLGMSLLAALDRRETFSLVCRAAQMSFNADTVILWMVDLSTREIEAVEVVGPKRRSLQNRRMSLDDPSSLAARVIRTGDGEIVQHAAGAGLSNGFLNVLLHVQSLVAVPVVHGSTVHGALVCSDARQPTLYGPQELAKAELLASQVAVAIDNAYQHDLQQRRLEDISALYRFAQALQSALSATEVVRQLLPTLKERLKYTYVAVWIKDPLTGMLRLAGGDGPGGVPLAGNRPSDLAMRAFNTGAPIHAGLGWSAGTPTGSLQRQGVRSQLTVPLVLKRSVIGVVDLENKQPNAYSVHDERLLAALANHAALAIDNLQLMDEARKVVALKELDRLKNDLLSTVSHELRTPLGSIKGYATTLLTHEAKLDKAERREFLEIIDSEADRLRELIENLLDLSRLGAGVLRIDRGPVLLEPIAQEVTRKVQLSSPHHKITCYWPEDHTIHADGRRMYQVLQNLMTNSVKYAPGGGHIELRGEFGRNELTVSVQDDGLGIPAQELGRIFDRFHRVPGDVSERIGGTGLGLAICKGFVEAHGGRIWAESEGEGRGSTFRFTIPFVRTPDTTSISTLKDHYEHEKAHRPGR